MTPNLENFCPKLRQGRVIPQGSRLIFETDNPYNQIVLPMALADLILLCGGQYSVREIVDRIYKKQGAVPFKSILTAIHLLQQGGFFENGDQLVLSSHLQSWMKPERASWHLSLRLKQRVQTGFRSPNAFYVLTLLALLGSIFGLQHVPERGLELAGNWLGQRSVVAALLQLWLAGAAIQTLRFTISGAQLLLLTSKAYNVSLRLSAWGPHLHVGEEANDLLENRLYTSMYHVGQVLVGWLAVFIGAFLVPTEALTPLVLMSLLHTLLEINPFRNGEGRKLIRTLLIANDRDVVSWHFEANTLINSINPEARRRDQDFARLCTLWGLIWLAGAFYVLYEIATLFGPAVLQRLTHFSVEFSAAFVGFALWMISLYYVVQTMVEILLVSVIKPYWSAFYSRLRQASLRPHKEWTTKDILANVEGLPLFSHFHEQYLDMIVSQSKVLHFAKGTTIVQQGESARELFVLLDGTVEVLRHSGSDDEWVTALNAVSVFGEAALVDDMPRAADVVTRSGATVLRVPVAAIRQAAEAAQSVRQIEVFRNAILVNQFFASSPVFRSLSTSSVEFLCSRGTLEYFEAGQTVFNQGDAGDSLFLILRGSIDVSVHQTIIKRLQQGSFFGEIALIANIPRTASIIACEPCVFFKISADAFWEVLVQHMDLGVFLETVSETRLKEDLAIARKDAA